MSLLERKARTAASSFAKKTKQQSSSKPRMTLYEPIGLITGWMRPEDEPPGSYCDDDPRRRRAAGRWGGRGCKAAARHFIKNALSAAKDCVVCMVLPVHL